MNQNDRAGVSSIGVMPHENSPKDQFAKLIPGEKSKQTKPRNNIPAKNQNKLCENRKKQKSRLVLFAIFPRESFSQ